MTINLIDARRGLHNKCLELFADKKIAEQIYRYLCDGIEDCEEAQPVKHGHWIWDKENDKMYCSECGYETDNWGVHQESDTIEWQLPNYCENCGADMRGEK